jgi:hypothetical protein
MIFTEGTNKMLSNLPEIKKVLSMIFTKTDELEKLSERVNELLIDELVKDFTLHRYHKEITSRYFIYEVKQDDFEHITTYLPEIQRVILPDVVVMAQTDEVDNFRVIFRKG